jgi:tetratricopeptide (TPR) repeat protein
MARLIKNLQQHFLTMRPASEAGPGIDLATAAATEDKSQGKQATAEDTQPEDAAGKERAAPAPHFEVDEDDRARHRAELDREKSKTRRARITAAALVVAVITAAASWYLSGNNQQALPALPPASDAVPTEIEQPTDTPEEPQFAAPADTTDAVVDFVAAEGQPDAEILEETVIDAVELPVAESVDILAEADAATPEDIATSVDVAEPGAAEPQAVAPPPATETVRLPDVSEYIGEGVRLAAIGDYEDAIASFDEALQMDSEAAFVYKQRGAAYQATGDHAAAISDFDEAIRLNSEDMNAYYRRGVSNQALENHAAAIADFDAVLTVDPEFIDAQSRRAAAQEALGNDGAAAGDKASLPPN